MAPDFPRHHDHSPEEELEELEEEKEEQVLHREPLEEELMEEGHSELGEHIDGVDHVE
jgi:hypothetical protein